MDNDAYGHVNNVTYYSYFDTVVNEHLIRAGGLDLHRDAAIGLVVETSCRFHRSLSFPETIEAALRVAHLGTSSVDVRDRPLSPWRRRACRDGALRARVGRPRRRSGPTPVPARIRAALQPLLVVEIS